MSEAKSGKRSLRADEPLYLVEEVTMCGSTGEGERVSIYAYDRVGGEGDLIVDREPLESDESYNRRTALYNYKVLFKRD
jgi:hypothetical protein